MCLCGVCVYVCDVHMYSVRSGKQEVDGMKSPKSISF